METSITLREWLRRATPELRVKLCELSNTPIHYLYQLASGRRSAKAEKAALIESATSVINRDHGYLTPVPRTVTCAACGTCPYAAAAKCKEGRLRAR